MTPNEVAICTGWSWAVLAAAFGGGFLLGIVAMSMFASHAYMEGWDDALDSYNNPLTYKGGRRAK